METAYKIVVLLMIIPLGVFLGFFILSYSREFNKKHAKWKMVSAIALAILFAAITIMAIVLGKKFTVQAVMIIVWTINAITAWVEYKKLK